MIEKPFSVSQLLTENEAAEHLRVCPRTLRKERQAARLAYIMIGRAIRYSAADLHDFIERARPCPSIADPALPIGSSISRSTVSDFAEALARRERGKLTK